jgi:hypothetical protein
MTDIHDIIAFSCDGEKILGVVIEHYTNPLDDFYIVYADYAIHKSYNPEEDSFVLIDNVIIPACDEALAEYRLKRQHLKDMNLGRKEIEALVEAITSKMGLNDIFNDDNTGIK